MLGRFAVCENCLFSALHKCTPGGVPAIWGDEAPTSGSAFGRGRISDVLAESERGSTMHLKFEDSEPGCDFAISSKL